MALPVRIYGSDGTNEISILTDANGRIIVTSSAGAPDTIQGAVTPADAAALGTTSVRTFALGGLYNGTTIDMSREVANATNSVGTGIAASGLLAQFDDVSPQTVTENSFGNLRMSNQGVLYVGGNIASGGTDAGNPVKVGGKYNLAPPTFTDGQRADLQANANGSLRIVLDAGGGAGAAVISNNTADNQASQVAVFVASQNKAFGGTNWDRVRTAVGSAAVNTGIGAMSVEEGGRTFSNVSTATTTTSKSGAGHLHTVTCNTPVASATLTLYDNTAGSGTKIATITLPAALVGEGPDTGTYDLAFSTGLTGVTTGTADWTWTYR